MKARPGAMDPIPSPRRWTTSSRTGGMLSDRIRSPPPPPKPPPPNAPHSPGARGGHPAAAGAPVPEGAAVRGGHRVRRPRVLRPRGLAPGPAGAASSSPHRTSPVPPAPSLPGVPVGLRPSRPGPNEGNAPPMSQAYREISSCSNYGDFQARRMKLRCAPGRQGMRSRFASAVVGAVRHPGVPTVACAKECGRGVGALGCNSSPRARYRPPPIPPAEGEKPKKPGAQAGANGGTGETHIAPLTRRRATPFCLPIFFFCMAPISPQAESTPGEPGARFLAPGAIAIGITPE